MIVKNVNLLLFDDIDTPIVVKIKTRYSSNEVEGIIAKLDSNTLKVKFKEPQPRITPGQSAVFYINDIVLGGGIIV